ncbi:MAG: hypothetical protein VKJ04_12155 [Vampirovibrionales bacterium]|nr:hypothetical protein [Vampirovibrionales bacterium]
MKKSPFDVSCTEPFVALQGKRKGYIQLAPAKRITTYRQLPPRFFEAAQDWAACLEESLASPRVYWITLSEEVPHLHVHLYPRWPQDEDKQDEQRGLPLFEARESSPQPAWDALTKKALEEWAKRFDVYLV